MPCKNTLVLDCGHVVLAVQSVDPPCKEWQMFLQECQANVHKAVHTLVQLCRDSRNILEQHKLEVSKLGQKDDPTEHLVKHMGSRVTWMDPDDNLTNQHI